MRRLLEKAFPSSEVMAVDTPAAGLQIIADGHVDLVISDYRMPGMNGVEFLQQCMQRQPDIERMLMTAFPGEAATPPLTKVPIVEKPLDIARFVVTVGNALASTPN